MTIKLAHHIHKALSSHPLLSPNSDCVDFLVSVNMHSEFNIVSSDLLILVELNKVSFWTAKSLFLPQGCFQNLNHFSALLPLVPLPSAPGIPAHHSTDVSQSLKALQWKPPNSWPFHSITITHSSSFLTNCRQSEK